MSDKFARWRGAIAATVSLAVVGIVEGNGSLLLAATLPLSYLAYGSISTVSNPPALAADRTIDPPLAPPGRPVTISLELRNDTDRTLADLRIVDQVPEELAVLNGSPRAGQPLEPDESITVEYTIIARRGEYDFDSPRVRLRGTSATSFATVDLQTDGDDRLVCRLDADAPPLANSGGGRVGRYSSGDPGPGQTFHSTREYQRGDPVGRIDWRSYAKRGSLSTINFDRWLSTTVLLVLDARKPACVAAGPGRPAAVELSAYAITHALSSLVTNGDDVAVAVVGIDGDGPSGLAWLPPGSGQEQRDRALTLLERAAEAATGSSSGDESGSAQFRELSRLAGRNAQIILASPLVDDLPVEAVEKLVAAGYPTTVLSPDVVASNTVSGQYEQIRRRTRLVRCQQTSALTIDWRRGTPLPTILAHTSLTGREDGAVVAMGGR